jgi:hypothetical protein
MIKKITLILLILLPIIAFSQTKAPNKNITFEGRMHFLSSYSNNNFQIKPERMRLFVFAEPAVNTHARLQYEFMTKRLYDAWISFFLIERQLELRLGRSWLPKFGEITDHPFMTDMIDKPAGCKFFQARDEGVFAIYSPKAEPFLKFYIGTFKGNGIFRDDGSYVSKDDNKHFDTMGSMALSWPRIKYFFGFFRGFDGPEENLVSKGGFSMELTVKPFKFFTLKGSATEKQLGEQSQDAHWLRAVYHLKKVDFIIERDYFDTTISSDESYVLGVNYYLGPRKNNNRIMLNFYHHTLRHVDKNEIKLQLQLISK